MVEPVRDFLRHELHVGDIVIWASPATILSFGRVTGFEGARGYHDGIVVNVLSLGGDRNIPHHHRQFEPDTLIWHSSDYRDVPDSLVMEILDFAGRYGRA